MSVLHFGDEFPTEWIKEEQVLSLAGGRKKGAFGIKLLKEDKYTL